MMLMNDFTYNVFGYLDLILGTYIVFGANNSLAAAPIQHHITSYRPTIGHHARKTLIPSNQ